MLNESKGTEIKLCKEELTDMGSLFCDTRFNTQSRIVVECISKILRWLLVSQGERWLILGEVEILELL